jgi:hypothetical protein
MCPVALLLLLLIHMDHPLTTTSRSVKVELALLAQLLFFFSSERKIKGEG